MRRLHKASKRPINLNPNASETAHTLLPSDQRRRYWELWKEDNREAIAAYNERIEREGLTLKKYRAFLKGR